MSDGSGFALLEAPPEVHAGSKGEAGFARLSRDSLLYAIGSVAGKVVGILMLPVMTRFLDPGEYGTFDLLSTLASSSISIVLLGMDVAATRLAMDPSESSRRSQVIGSWLALQFAILVPFSIALILAAPAIARLLVGPDQAVESVRLVGLIVLAGTFQFLTLTMLRIQRRPVAYGLIATVTLVANGLLSIGLLIFWHADERAPLLGLALSLMIGTVAGFLVAGRQIIAWPSAHAARSVLALGLPLVPAVAATWIAEFANRALLLNIGSAQELGYLAVALRFASVASLVLLGFQLGWQPHAFGLGTSEAALRQSGNDAGRILVITGGAVVIVAAGSPEGLAILIGSSFAPALAVIGFALLGVLAMAWYLVASMPSILAKKTRDLGLSGAIGVAVTIAANLALAPRFGAVGTAGAIAAGQGVASLLVWRLGARHLTFPVPLRSVGAITGVAAIAVLISTIPSGGSPLLVRGAVVLGFAFLLWREGALRVAVGSLRIRGLS